MRLKASWVVRAGIIPNQPIETYSKHFEYTSDDFAEDQKNDENFKNKEDIKQVTVGLAYHSRFARIRAEAIDYFLQMNNPAVLNWAELIFFWY